MSHPAGTTQTAHGQVTVTEDGRVLNDPTHAQLPGHGNTPGAWAMCALVVVGFVAGAIGLFTGTMIIVWIAVAIAVVGVVVGVVAGRAGAGSHH
jgi:CHASE2 domain-containing sensor protein